MGTSRTGADHVLGVGWLSSGACVHTYIFIYIYIYIYISFLVRVYVCDESGLVTWLLRRSSCAKREGQGRGMGRGFVRDGEEWVSGVCVQSAERVRLLDWKARVRVACGGRMGLVGHDMT